MQTIHLSTGNLDELLSVVRAIDNSTFGMLGQTRLYRGQRNATWPLIPSLFRHKLQNFEPKNLAVFETLERALINEFFHRAEPYAIKRSENALVNLAIAQHFGVPTQLLDWSLDIFVALFFALEEPDSADDASLFTVTPGSFYIHEFKSLKKDFPVNVESDLIAFRPPHLDMRITAQKSVFTASYYETDWSEYIALERRGTETQSKTFPSGMVVGGATLSFYKIQIPQRFKFALYSTLISMGIDRSALFPGMDGIGRSSADKIKYMPAWLFQSL